MCIADNATVRLDLDNEVQPNVLQRVESPPAAPSSVSDDGYPEGAPEPAGGVAGSG